MQHTFVCNVYKPRPPPPLPPPPRPPRGEKPENVDFTQKKISSQTNCNQNEQKREEHLPGRPIEKFQ